MLVRPASNLPPPTKPGLQLLTRSKLQFCAGASDQQPLSTKIKAFLPDSMSFPSISCPGQVTRLVDQVRGMF